VVNESQLNCLSKTSLVFVISFLGCSPGDQKRNSHSGRARSRNIIAARLTLFNARHGGEPSGLEWKDVWLPNSVIKSIQDPAEQVLVGKLKIAYQARTQHLVSLLKHRRHYAAVKCDEQTPG